jgi:Cu(I)/Ag(I) efflux system periplasmic protein CusF
MQSRRWCALLLVSVLAGCASYELPPVAAGHPAHPDAPVAPPPPRSRTLDYSPSEVPSVQPAAATPAPGHEPPRSHGAPPAAAAPAPSPRIVVGEGEVVSTAPRSGQIVVDHEEIKGFMAPMTMGYRVDPPSLLEAVKEGDRVRFTIDVQRRAIVKLEKLR